jgi:hypothetical protein
MKRSKVVWVCIAACIAAAGATASDAAAFVEEAPEVGRCLKHAGGRWKDGGCKVAAKPGEEKYEWYPAFGPAQNGEARYKGDGSPETEPHLGFSSVGKEGTLIQVTAVSGEGLGCTGWTAQGEVTGPKSLRLSGVAWTGCRWNNFNCVSSNPVASEPGEIKMQGLVGQLGVEKFGETTAKDAIAEALAPEEGEIVAEYECGGIPFTVRGEIMHPVSENIMKVMPTVTYTASKGKQKPEKFATDPTGTKRVLETSKLVGGGFVQTGVSMTTIQTNEEAWEISSVN